jgi:WD40 repeat protein
VCRGKPQAGLAGREGRTDGAARFWDAATGRPIGPPLVHKGPVVDVAFRPDGKMLLTGSADSTARLWDVPDPVEGDEERIDCWIHVLTGLEFDAYDAIRPMDIATWREQRRRLNKWDSSPEP